MEFMLEHYESDSGVAKFLGVTRQNVRSQREGLGIPLRRKDTSKRDIAIIKLRAEGVSAKKIATKMLITQRHVRRIISNMEVKNDTG